MESRHDHWLLQLTGLPTAPGCEDRVIDWVLRWARRRPSVTTRRDRYGNLLLRRLGSRTIGPNGLICFTAHMDHPAFVATKLIGERVVEADFRGGVDDGFFIGSRVLFHHERQRPQRGTIATLEASATDKRVTIRFGRKPAEPVAGRVLTWDTGPPRVKKGRLLAPACDNLAGVAAALSAFDALGPRSHVGVLLTRAEEIGFVGAIGACSSGILPVQARTIVLECSKSFDHSPIGAGPILRVGDRTSTFNPDLTRHLGRVAGQTAFKHTSFRWQRCLMPGGTCEATAYQAYGRTAACLCLPLGRYHNMNQHTKTIDAEVIDLSDYHNLIWWLVAAGQTLDHATVQTPLRQHLDRLFEQRRSLLGR